MERREAEKCLTKIGEFLVRKAIIRGSEAHIVSVRANVKEVLHLRIQEILPQKLYWLRLFCFTSVSDLIRYHLTLKVPVYGDILLRSYVEREQWQLYHEQEPLL
ncbi:SH2 domain protein [Oesophagostomum dentatum]|uniref:SH2 domain protein n=1 Tax=Oesophagostomum dentatum TaxID=61180 RepID=A0A0B1SCG5_OESDE|nr:SH2 domain protein [Oesophagostomum dentatum]